MSTDKTNGTIISLIVLTHNAEKYLDLFFLQLQQQVLLPQKILVVDSLSTDATLTKLKQHSVQIHNISCSEFNHGTTRKLATQLVDADIYIFMTQDAMLADEYAIANLVQAFHDPKVGCAYGRQLPHQDATILAQHSRLFNYSEISSVKTYADREKYGIKTCFISDSFAAYRKQALQEIGSFPENVILSEDMYVAAKMLLGGWKVAYQADARVFHSHNYSVLQEFKRYFDIGVFHKTQPWIRENFHGTEKEGRRYVISEVKYCLSKLAIFSLLQSFVVVFAKYLGFNLGLHYQKLPKGICRKLSMSRNFFADRR